MASANPVRPAPPAFVFVIHAGGLEAKSALLACTLRQKLQDGQRIVAAEMMPTKRWGAISHAARELLNQLKVEIVASENEIDLNYPHGNKISAMATIDGPAIFLDSDMMMMRPFINHYSLLGADAALKVADIDTFVRGGGGWSRPYKLFDLPMPGRILKATSTGESIRPYYNAGFVSVANGALFSKVWLETARKIDADAGIHNKRPWLDQIALPIALTRMNWSVSEVSTLLNFPAHLEPWGATLPYIVHYHFPRIVLENEELAKDVRFYMGKYPKLRPILAADPEWEAIART